MPDERIVFSFVVFVMMPFAVLAFIGVLWLLVAADRGALSRRRAAGDVRSVQEGAEPAGDLGHRGAIRSSPPAPRRGMR